ncbi:MAG: YihY/virulence factor BrkB family protein, partial [Burkholderiales bacterium]|nr:YihY/virulence factor BrkB family protein [Burkholderiales bacterium]
VLGWIEHRASSMGAALAFYTLFSMAPVIIIAIAVAGAFFGQEAARGEIFRQLSGLIGEAGALAIQGMIENARNPTSGAIAAVIGLGTFIVAATAVFAELKDSLDFIWGFKNPRRAGIIALLRTRLLSFGLIIAMGFLLMVSLIISAVLAALSKYWGAWLEGTAYLLEAVNFAVSFSVIATLFALIYKLLPDKRIAWHDVWIGAAITAVLFTIGNYLIGIYLGRSAIASTFGAAGSVIVVLMWVYYSAQIFLLGAEFTKLYAYRYGSLRGSEEKTMHHPSGGIQYQQ